MRDPAVRIAMCHVAHSLWWWIQGKRHDQIGGGHWARDGAALYGFSAANELLHVFRLKLVAEDGAAVVVFLAELVEGLDERFGAALHVASLAEFLAARVDEDDGRVPADSVGLGEQAVLLGKFLGLLGVLGEVD